MPYVLALDQGTTSSRAIVFDEFGAIRGLDQREFPQHYPQPGWVEHGPHDLWRSQLQTAQGALRNAGLEAADIAALGITNQRETVILWDRVTGVPVHNAIVWQDRRTADVCEDLRSRGLEATVREKTGLLLDPYFSASKITWLLDTIPGLRERAERGDIAFGTVDTWLIWNLTNGASHVTDYTNASRTSLFDLVTLDWSDELLEIFRIPKPLLPRALPCTGDFGTTAPALLGAPLKIAGVAGDQHAALVGQTCFRKGLAKNTYGTGSFLLANTGDEIVRSEHGLLTTIAYATQPKKATYALEGSIFVTGAAVQWLRDGLGIIAASADIEELAVRASDNGGVYFVPAFAGLGAPHWDPYARGTIVGLTRGSTGAHIARAALEAMAYQTVDVVDVMAQEGGRLAELRVDGGAATNDLTMQFQADVLGVDVVRPAVAETTALGAAYLAGLSVGLWPDLAALERQWQEQRRFKPSIDAKGRAALLQQWQRAIERSKGWARD
jgi:glycerol kinase